MWQFFKKAKVSLKQKLADRKMNNPDARQFKSISSNIKENLQRIQNLFGESGDIIIREFELGVTNPIEAAVVYIEGLTDKQLINTNVLNRVMGDMRRTWSGQKMNTETAHQRIKKQILSTSEVNETTIWEEMMDGLLSGETVFFINGTANALIIGSRSWEMRSVEDPVTESVIRGPREGFSETLRVNTAMLRRKIKSPDLKFETLRLGRHTRTELAICWLANIANPKIVAEVRQRLHRIDIDGVLESGYLEELIEDSPASPFPQIDHTERSDKAAASLLEGRVLIMVDGTPFVLIVPTVFWQFLQATEDYYERYQIASLIRWIRILAVNISLLLPSLYIAITTFHQEMLPSVLLITIAGAREGIPFPAVVEAFVMEITFEILREGGIRLPKPVGQAVSIVGALVIGQAAVEAGIVSPAMVIVVAMTAISSFVIPQPSAGIALRMLRFPLMILAATLGLFGVMVGLIAIQIHLASLRSFGVPYLSPVAPTTAVDMKDVFFRPPWWAMMTRPRLLSGTNMQRIKRDSIPHPKPRRAKEIEKAKPGDDNRGR